MKSLSRFYSYTLIALGFGLVFIYLCQQPTNVVGDGSEYYALYYAWKDTLRPWMSSVSFASYQEFASRGEVAWLWSADRLAEAFPSLRVRETADFNHFWFYSFLACVATAPFQALGWFLTAHQGFLLLHYILLLGMCIVLFQLYRWHGLVAALIMLLLSPMLWYLDKVHTELFTFVFCILAIALVYRKYYLFGAFCLAIASTQNPSFALIAFIPFCYQIYVVRAKSFTIFEVILILGTVFFVLLHPTYYFFRYGIPTPQLLAGGADLGGNLSNYYIWLFDPDLGLLPYWPIGIVCVFVAIFLFYTKKTDSNMTVDKGKIFFTFFIIAYVFINLFAHSSTTNLNSGASAGPSRYALWYLPIFLPILLYVLVNITGRKVLVSLFILSLGLNSWYNFQVSNPSEYEKVAVPSYISSFVQTFISTLYSPPDEVFSEKYSGLGENINWLQPRAIMGPDCRKILLFPGENRTLVTAPPHCFVDTTKLLDIVNLQIQKSEIIATTYIWLDDGQRNASKLQLKSGDYQVGYQKDGNFIMASGWSDLEDFGVWSNGSLATLSLPCNSQQFYYDYNVLNLKLVVQPFGSQHLMLKHNNQILFQGKLSALSEINVVLNPGHCDNSSFDLKIHIEKPRSPLELGQSHDPRLLGVALLGYSLN